MAGFSFGRQARNCEAKTQLAAMPESGEDAPVLNVVSEIQRHRVKESSATGRADEFAIVDDHFPS